MRRGTMSGTVLVAFAGLASLGGCPAKECHCSIITNQLPGARVGQPYEAQLQATVSCSYDFSGTQTNPTSPNWSMSAGALPPGIALSQSGAITGTPSAPGTFEVTVAADCSSGDRPTKPLTIVVAPA
jgi:hypothetical protein